MYFSEYGVQTEYLLRDVEIPTDVLLCKNCNCTIVEHKAAWQKYYDSIVCAITTAGQNTIKTNKPSKGKKCLTCQVGINLHLISMICLEKRIPCGKMLVVPCKVHFLT